MDPRAVADTCHSKVKIYALNTFLEHFNDHVLFFSVYPWSVVLVID